LTKIEKILASDGNEIKEQLVLGSLFLMIFERFKNYVEDDLIKTRIYIPQQEFDQGLTHERKKNLHKSFIETYGEGQESQHKNKIFRAILTFLHKKNEITLEELETVEKLYSLRNEIGHELFDILTNDEKPSLSEKNVQLCFKIYRKLIRWHIKWGLEKDCPKMLEEHSNFEGVENIETLQLAEIISKALHKNI
jgi:hypothetical protein